MYIEWDSSDKSLQAYSGNSLLKSIIIPIVNYHYKHYFDVELLKCTFNGVVAKKDNNIVPEGRVTFTCSGTRIYNNTDYKEYVNFNIHIICGFSQGKLNGDYFVSYFDDNNTFKVERIMYTYMNDGNIGHKFLTINNEGVKENKHHIDGKYNDLYDDDENNGIYYYGEIITYEDGNMVEQIDFGCSLDTFDLNHVDNAKYILHNYNKLLNYKLYSTTIVDYNLGISKYVEYIWPLDKYTVMWDPNIKQGIFQYYKKYNADGKLTLMWYQNGIDHKSNVVKSSHQMSEKYNIMSSMNNTNYITSNIGVHIGSYLGHYQINGIPELPNVNLVPIRGEKSRDLRLIDKNISIRYHENGNLHVVFIGTEPSRIYEFNEQGQLIT